MIAFIQRYALYGMCAVILALGIYAGIQKLDAAHWHKSYDAEHAAYQQAVANYLAAADEAARLDKANVARVAKEQSAITERVTHDYESKLADSASRYDRLRTKAADYLSGAGAEGVPATSDATCQAVAGTDCENLPALLKAAQDNTDQLLALQDWVRAQSTVDTNGTP